MEPKITIITAVYNAEKYLKECIDSLLMQDFEAWEMICINDGSTDLSGEILEAYALRDPRIRLFHQENKGVSKARNWALELARAPLLCFLDSDDFFIKDSALSLLVKAFKQNPKLDFLSYNYQIIDFDQKIISSPMPRHLSLDYAKRSLINRYDFAAFICQYVIRRDFFQGIKFPENRIYEDNAVSFLLFAKAREYRYISEVLYAYRKHLDSLTAKDDYNRLDMLFTLDELFDKMDTYILDEDKVKATKSDLALFIISSIRGIFAYAIKDIGFLYAYNHFIKSKKYIQKYRKYAFSSRSWDYRYLIANLLSLYLSPIYIILLLLRKKLRAFAFCLRKRA